MRLTLAQWDLLTKHAHPRDRAWCNDDVRELVVHALGLEAQLRHVAAREVRLTAALERARPLAIVEPIEPDRAHYLRMARKFVRMARDERDLPRTMSYETGDSIRERVDARVRNYLVMARQLRDKARRQTRRDE